MFVCCECCVLSGRGLCDELVTCREESYRLWCVVVCDLENLVNEEAMTRSGSQRNMKAKCFLIAQHVSGDTPPIIRSSKTVIAAYCFTYIRFWYPAAAMAEP